MVVMVTNMHWCILVCVNLSVYHSPNKATLPPTHNLFNQVYAQLVFVKESFSI